MARFVILTEGRTHPSDAKTASCLVRYRTDEVVALLDSQNAGRTAGEVLGVGGSIPIVARLTEADGADTLVIGIAPAGGGLPESWREIIMEAIERRLEVQSGLHTFLADDPELAELARAHGVRLWDIRRPPETLTVNQNRARDTRCLRIHTVGTDCSVGKMVATYELARALRARDRDARFLATGQTGILISGRGVPIDRTISDFTAGAAEGLVLENRDAEIVLVEGQGSIVHPMYAGVTLSLLHGSAPSGLILCYEAGRELIRHTDTAIPPFAELIATYEWLARAVHPAQVIGIAANTRTLSEAEARREVARREKETGLPVTDVIRFGSEKLVEAIEELERP